MEKRNYDSELDECIRMSMEIRDIPSVELNNKLRADIYSREAAMRREMPARAVSLWYLPMTLNLITFLLLAIAALLVINNPYLSALAAGICLYIGFAGVALTIVGVRRANIKEDITIHVRKRGVLV